MGLLQYHETKSICNPMCCFSGTSLSFPFGPFKGSLWGHHKKRQRVPAPLQSNDIPDTFLLLHLTPNTFLNSREGDAISLWCKPAAVYENIMREEQNHPVFVSQAWRTKQQMGDSIYPYWTLHGAGPWALGCCPGPGPIVAQGPGSSPI